LNFIAYREPDNPAHWYSAYQWEEKRENAKSHNGCVTKAVPVPKEKVQAVRRTIAREWPMERILSFITIQEKV
jgi:hypothetical protein